MAKASARTSGTRGHKSVRLVGLELGGGKSGRTALVALDYYPAQKKLFIARHVAHIVATGLRTGDEVLLEGIHDLNARRVAVNAPLTMPPCMPCASSHCGGVRECKEKPVRWMREEAERVGISPLKFPTPYTQRPLDIYLRSRVQPHFQHDLFIEESMGSGRGPLALRFQFLRSRLEKVKWLEVHPRLSLLAMAPYYRITDRELRRYRNPEDGVGYRHSILEKLGSNQSKVAAPEVFLYESDLGAIAEDLTSFYALVSALSAAFAEQRLVEKAEPDFDLKWGFLTIPKFLSRP